MTDNDASEYVLKVPEGNSIGITPELVELIKDKGRIELYGEMLVPGHGMSGGSVPIDALEELVEGWNETLQWAEEHDEICSNEAIAVGKRKTNELQNLIEDHE